MAFAALREENRTLNTTLEATEKEMAVLRKKYVELLMKTERVIQDAAQLQMGAAHLIDGVETGGSHKTDDSTGQLLRVISETRRRLVELANEAADCEKIVGTALETCGASQVIQREVKNSFGGVRKKIDASLNPLVLSESNGVALQSAGCVVLLLDESLKLAVVDQGFLNGLRVGGQLELRRNDIAEEVFQIVECRPQKAVIQLLKGDFRRIAPGTLLQRPHPGNPLR